MRNKKLLLTSFAAIFAALTAISIYILHIPYANTGYVHLGDCIIFLCACMLPAPYSILSAGIGGGLADLLSGFPIYIIPTVIIKSLSVLPFSYKQEKIFCKRNICGAVIAAIINIVLYAVTELIFGLAVYGMPLAGALTTALATILQNAIQGASNIVLFLLIAALFDKLQIKNKLTL